VNATIASTLASLGDRETETLSPTTANVRVARGQTVVLAAARTATTEAAVTAIAVILVVLVPTVTVSAAIVRVPEAVDAAIRTSDKVNCVFSRLLEHESFKDESKKD